VLFTLFANGYKSDAYVVIFMMSIVAGSYVMYHLIYVNEMMNPSPRLVLPKIECPEQASELADCDCQNTTNQTDATNNYGNYDEESGLR